MLRLLTSILRGLGGGVLFGTSLWLTGLLVIEEKDAMEDDPGVDEDLGQESIKIDTEAVRKSFWKNLMKLKKNNLKIKRKHIKKKQLLSNYLDNGYFKWVN